MLALAALIMCGCRDEPVRTSFTSAPPHIDGDLTEWKSVPVRVFPEKNIAIGALRDSSYLYVAARSADEEVNRAITRRGFTMWIDPDAGEKKDLEIHYPSSGNETLDPTRGGFWEAMTDSERSRASDRLGKMRNGVLVIDRRGINSRLFPPDSAEGFGAASAESNGILTVEVRIPLHPEMYFPSYTSMASKEKIRIGIAAGASPASRVSERGDGFSGPMGYPSGGRMGGGRRGMSPRLQPAGSGSDVWVDVILSKGS